MKQIFKPFLDMELKINIGYNELFEMIKQLPPQQFFQLQIDLSKVHITEKVKTEKKGLKKLLLNGPAMSDEQYENYQENRKWMNQWRTEI